MLRLHPLLSYNAPELAPYRTMKFQVDHQRQGIFVAEGEKVVRRLLESRLPVASVLLPQKWLADFSPLIEQRAEVIEVFIVEKKNWRRSPGIRCTRAFSPWENCLPPCR